MVTVIIRGDGDQTAMASNPDSQIIKRSIAYRAKYRADLGAPSPTFRTMVPSNVVPHPKNRAVNSMRTKQLVGTITKNACDVDEANSSAVAVQEQPSGRRREHAASGAPHWTSLQSDFESRSASDSDIAKCQDGIAALLGSLSHGHLNCGNRNILCGE